MAGQKRNRASAKSAGSGFERLTADTLNEGLGQPWVDRLPKHGSKDIGDVGHVYLDLPSRAELMVECKELGGTISGSVWKEVEVQKENLGAAAAVAVFKRKGKSAGNEQWVLMTLGELIAIINTVKNGRDTIE